MSFSMTLASFSAFDVGGFPGRRAFHQKYHGYQPQRHHGQHQKDIEVSECRCLLRLQPLACQASCCAATGSSVCHKNTPRSCSSKETTAPELESSMNQVQVEQKSYQMPPKDGITVAHFLTVADIERSLRFYETVFGSSILSRGDSKGAPGYIQIANTWLIVNVGGGPTPDKPSVTLSVPANPDSVNSFMNIRVADIQACYELWRSRGAEFITEPKAKYGETRCYIRDPDGYIIEVGQSNPGVAYG
jgi:predicted enzyme related to lactoylglutathione lyase